MSGARGIPLPRPTPLSQPHWDGCREERLLLQRCGACARHIFVPQPLCPACQSADLTWVECRGTGSLYSYTIVHRPQRPEFAVPYVVAIVELDEGAYLLTNLVDCDPGAIEIGMRLQVSFRKMSDQITLPYFRPITSAARPPADTA
jgi:uncharacterized OB-fold protein